MGLKTRIAAVLFLFFLCLDLMSPLSQAISEPIFSVVWITDTQYLVDRFPNNLDVICNWIVNNSEIYNVKMVIHTGDIVEHSSNLTEWYRANDSMGILLDNGIPYCWNAGNHDQLGKIWSDMNFTAFNTTLLSEKPYWVDAKIEGKNTAVHFTSEDWDFLIVNIEFRANDTVLGWANDLLDSHPASHVIIGTHSYLNETCTYDDWAIHFRDTVLANHSNVFMTLNGHFIASSRTNRTFVDNRHELFFNYQHTNGGLGDSTIRILTFMKDKGIISVSTYNPVTGTFLTDSDNQFMLDIPFDDREPYYSPIEPENYPPSLPSIIPEFPSATILFIPLLSTILIAAIMRRRLGKRNTQK